MEPDRACISNKPPGDVDSVASKVLFKSETLTSMKTVCPLLWAFQEVLVVKNPPASAGDLRDEGSIPVSGRSSEGGHGNPLQYSCLENPTDRGAWQATVHRVAKSRTQLRDVACTHTFCMQTSFPLISRYSLLQPSVRRDLWETSQTKLKPPMNAM